MPQIRLSVFSLGLALLVGFSRSDECSDENIQACWQQEQDDYCPYYRSITDCLQGLAKNCQDDQVKSQLEYYIQGSKARAEQCPGLEDGHCFASELIECHKTVPFDVKFRPEMTDDEKKAQCDKFNGQEKATLDCLDKVSGICTGEHAHRELEKDIKDVKDVMEICGNLN